MKTERPKRVLATTLTSPAAIALAAANAAKPHVHRASANSPRGRQLYHAPSAPHSEGTPEQRDWNARIEAERAARKAARRAR